MFIFSVAETEKSSDKKYKGKKILKALVKYQKYSQEMYRSC
jgi:hypothetical protein